MLGNAARVLPLDLVHVHTAGSCARFIIRAHTKSDSHMSFSVILIQLLKVRLQQRWSHLHFICISSVHNSCHSVFHSFHRLINSINWPALSVWVFIAKLVEHCSANAEATGSNPVETRKPFFGLLHNCFNCDYNCDDHIFISFVFPQFTIHFIL